MQKSTIRAEISSRLREMQAIPDHIRTMNTLQVLQVPGRYAPCSGTVRQVLAGVNVLSVVVEYVVERFPFRDELAYALRKVSPHNRRPLAFKVSVAARTEQSGRS